MKTYYPEDDFRANDLPESDQLILDALDEQDGMATYEDIKYTYAMNTGQRDISDDWLRGRLNALESKGMILSRG